MAGESDLGEQNLSEHSHVARSPSSHLYALLIMPLSCKKPSWPPERGPWRHWQVRISVPLLVGARHVGKNMVNDVAMEFVCLFIH